ncbi:MAG: DegV family protein, partial [Brachymonas sp.]|nr:DegV family protein [Brachymonas sp.]
LESMRNRTNAYFTLDNLGYLVKSGRLSAPAGMIANLIGIKPLLQITQGQIVPVGRIRTLERALETLVDSIFNFIGNQPYEIYAMVGAKAAINHTLFDIVRSKYGVEIRHSYPNTPAVGAHTGPDGIGLGVVLGHQVLA